MSESKRLRKTTMVVRMRFSRDVSIRTLYYRSHPNLSRSCCLSPERMSRESVSVKYVTNFAIMPNQAVYLGKPQRRHGLATYGHMKHAVSFLFGPHPVFQPQHAVQSIFLRSSRNPFG
jgi:hypothetical protein